MKKIINGRLYDTDTATKIGNYTNGALPGDFHHFEEDLYQKRNGEFFLVGSGGALTKYGSYFEGESYSVRDTFIPLTVEEAKKWAEKHLEVDKYIALFGDVEE